MSDIKLKLYDKADITEEQIKALRDAALDNFIDFLENGLGVVIGMCPCMEPSMSEFGPGGMSVELGPQKDCLACKGTGIAIADKAAVEAAEAAAAASGDEPSEEEVSDE